MNPNQIASALARETKSSLDHQRPSSISGMIAREEGWLLDEREIDLPLRHLPWWHVTLALAGCFVVALSLAYGAVALVRWLGN